MKRQAWTFALATLLGGCGADTMSAVATGASIQKQELEQGQKTLQDMREKINQATQQLHQPRPEE